MRKYIIKKAHVIFLKKELVFVFAALIMIAFTSGFFISRAGGGAELRREIISPPEKTESAAAPLVTQDKAAAKKVNINSAGAEELKSLPGIGDALAGRIISYREARGGFKSIEELMNVNGIGEKTFDKIRDQIILG